MLVLNLLGVNIFWGTTLLLSTHNGFLRLEALVVQNQSIAQVIQSQTPTKIRLSLNTNRQNYVNLQFF